MNLTTILKEQSNHYLKKLNEASSSVNTEAELYIAYHRILKEFITTVFKPINNYEKEDFITLERTQREFDQIMQDCKTIRHLFTIIEEGLVDDYELLSQYKEKFNNVVEDFKEKIKDIEKQEKDEGQVIFTSNFSNLESDNQKLSSLMLEKIDKNITIESITIKGNGQAGNYGTVEMDSSKRISPVKFKSKINPNDKKEHLIDQEVTTWMEYQKVFLNNDFDNSILNMEISMTLKNREEVNWMELSPYYKNSTSKNLDIRMFTSVDGLSFEEVENIYYKNKDKNQNIIMFDTRECKYIKINISQTTPYEERFGIEKYYSIEEIGDNSSEGILIDINDVPESIIEGSTGVYIIEEEVN